MEYLVLGAEGAGKSLLIRRIKEILNNEYSVEICSEATIPTVGVEMTYVDIKKSDLVSNSIESLKIASENQSNSTKKKDAIELCLREIGSSIYSRWNSYYNNCIGIIFLIDISDFGSIAASFILLNEVLSYKDEIILKNKPILIVLNKLDLVFSINELVSLKNFLLLEDIQIRYASDVVILEGSCIDSTASSARNCIDWLVKRHT